MDEVAATLALRHTRGLGPRTARRLLVAYGTAAKAAAAWQEWPARGLTSAAVAQAFGARSWQQGAEAEARAAERLQAHILPWSHPGYPRLLRQIPDPPMLLYGRGRLELLAGPCVAVVGARQSSRYGLEMATTLARDLARAGVCVVSGLAVGIDRAAHEGALSEVGGSCAVLGTGIDLIYPAAHQDVWCRLAESGVVVTEFPPGTRPEGRNFPFRNRIISGLSLGVVVVEAALKSGSLVTASLAAAQGREVFAVPGPATVPTFHGSHQLLRDGAILVQNGADVLQALAGVLRHYAPTAPAPPKPLPPDPAPIPEVRPPEPVFPDEDSSCVWRLLDLREPRHVDAITQTLGWDAGRVSAALLLLEMAGLVRQHPGMYYTATSA